jgi:hypothetical protein
METKREFKTWRELLDYAISNSQERQRIVREVDVKLITLRRWISGESLPREENIYRLARALPPDLMFPFLNLVEVDFPTFVREKVEVGPVLPEVPSELYHQMFKIYAQTPKSLVSQHLRNLLLERAIEHLDPNKVGMCITFVSCVPPLPGQKIRSLRQVSGIGTTPWERDLERKTIFLGTESLAGNAVMTSQLISVESRDAISPFPIQWTEHENSAVAMPILRQSQIAGVLLASSTQPFYFTPTHQSLFELYAQLAALIFPPNEFYKPREIQLEKMPDYEVQKSYFSNFEQRVIRKQGEAMGNGHFISTLQARQTVWQEIAEELLLRAGNP